MEILCAFLVSITLNPCCQSSRCDTSMMLCELPKAATSRARVNSSVQTTKSARKAAIGWVVRMVLALLLIGLAVKLGLLGLVSQ